MIDILDLSIQFSGENLFENVNLRINREDKIAMVGANGTGKSTFLKLLAGYIEPETGTIAKPKGTRIGYLPQELLNKDGKSLFDEVKSSISEIDDIIQAENQITEQLENDTLSSEEKEALLNQLGELHHKKDETNFYSADSEIEKVLMGLGFEMEDFSKQTGQFSGGWQMRIELAKILLCNNDIILLDEPTNHLDIDSLEWLISFLKQFNGAIVVVSHDKYFVNQITNRTLEIFTKKVTFYRGKYDDYLEFKRERDLQLEATFKNQQQKIKETERFIERFRYKSTKAKQVQSRVKQLEKIERIELSDTENRLKLKFPEPPRSGVIPIEIKNLRKSYGNHLVIDNLNMQVERGEKIAFLGPNGAGKTTLSRIIAGNLAPSSGEVIIGHNTEVSYYAQEVANNLDLEQNVLEAVSTVSSEFTEGQLRKVLGSFLFSNDDVYKKIKVLSGGEKSRVALAKIMLTKANVIVLDEPTNHLDITSKEILQQALIDFTGTLIIVSHDVDFIRPIANKIIEIRKNKIQYFYGDIDYYRIKRKEMEESVSTIENNKSAEKTVSKKEQKRLEAEIRQKKYQATKNISKEIEKLELKIAELEEKKLILEDNLADELIYSDPEKLRQTNKEYEQTKTELDSIMDKWTELSVELEEIEESFQKQFDSI